MKPTEMVGDVTENFQALNGMHMQVQWDRQYILTDLRIHPNYVRELIDFGMEHCFIISFEPMFNKLKDE